MSDTNIVFAYPTSDHGKRLEEKFKKEPKPGTWVITVSFNLPNWMAQYVGWGKIDL